MADARRRPHAGHGQDVVQVQDYAHTLTVTDRVAIEVRAWEAPK